VTILPVPHALLTPIVAGAIHSVMLEMHHRLEELSLLILRTRFVDILPIGNTQLPNAIFPLVGIMMVAMNAKQILDVDGV